MAKRKGSRDPFKYLDNFFTDDANVANLFNVLVREIFNNMDDADVNSLLVYGINMKMDHNGEPVVEQFGNVKKLQNGTKVMEEREPLVDVINKKNKIVIIAEVPGVDKEDIKITARPSEIEILAKSKEQERNYFKKVNLPKSVLLKTGSAIYNNGVIEINIRTGSDSEGEETIRIK